MIYCIDPTAEEPIFLINKHIGFDNDEGMGIDGALFQTELLQVDMLGKKRIQVWINSPGGVVEDGYNIYSSILKSTTPVDTYCIGQAASIAGVIFQSGRKRIMSDFAWLMYHNPFGGENKTLLKTYTDSIITMIAQRCGMTIEQVAEMMNRTTFILADEAKKMNLCDSIDQSNNANTKYLRGIKDSLSFHKECNKVLNSIITKPIKPNQMIKVCMKLGLNDAAPEESIVKAIEAIEAKYDAAQKVINKLNADAEDKAKNEAEEMDKLKAKLKAKEEAADKAKNELDACTNELNAFKKDKEKAEDDAKFEKAKNMVESFAVAGRLKNEEVVKNKWIALAKSDFDGTKEMIEAIPLNKPAVSLEKVVNVIERPTTAAYLREQNRRNAIK